MLRGGDQAVAGGKEGWTGEICCSPAQCKHHWLVLCVKNPWQNPRTQKCLISVSSVGSLPWAAEKSSGEGGGGSLEVTSSVVTALEVTRAVV